MRKLVASAQDLGLIPGTHRVLHNLPNSSSRGPDVLFLPTWVTGMHMVHTDETPTHKIEMNTLPNAQTLSSASFSHLMAALFPLKSNCTDT